MIQTFTTQFDDVVRYMYNETSAKENELITESLMEHPELLEFYLDSLEIKAEMDKIKLNPSDAVVNRILAFARG